MTTEIISGVIGLLSGAAGSLIAPWSNSNIKIIEFRHKQRIDLISEIRNNINTYKYDRTEFENTIWYSKIKRHFKGEINTLKQINDELTRLEIKWKII